MARRGGIPKLALALCEREPDNDNARAKLLELAPPVSLAFVVDLPRWVHEVLSVRYGFTTDAVTRHGYARALGDYCRALQCLMLESLCHAAGRNEGGERSP